MRYPAVFRSTRPPSDRSHPAPLMWLCPLQGTTHSTCHVAASDECRKLAYLAPLMESRAPPTLKPERIHSTPVCLTGYVPPSGFLTLSAAYSSLRRLALFHAIASLGFTRSSGVFPRHQVPTARRRRIALLTFSPAEAPSFAGASIDYHPTRSRCVIRINVHRIALFVFRALLQ